MNSLWVVMEMHEENWRALALYEKKRDAVKSAKSWKMNARDIVKVVEYVPAKEVRQVEGTHTV